MIDDDLTTLRSSPALPVTTDEENQSVPSLASMLGRNVDLAALITVLSPMGLDQPAVMSLLRGKRPVTPEIANAVSSVTGVEPAQVAGAVQPLPARFVEEVDHPRWRPVWRERAERTGSREGEARLAASYEMFARAARQTGAQEPDWHARLAQFRVLERPSGAS
jgi:DNA-binding transcriptional regulator YdaS (Cro superfamily)